MTGKRMDRRRPVIHNSRMKTGLRAIVAAAGLAWIGAGPAATDVRLGIPGARNEHVTLAAAGSVVAAVAGALVARPVPHVGTQLVKTVGERQVVDLCRQVIAVE